MTLPLLFFLVAGDHGFGLLPPVKVPDVIVTTEDNRQQSLRALIKGRSVALQFIFTECLTVCPLLGSLFQSVEKRLDPDRPILLLSVSVDPEQDTPQRLHSWLSDFRKGERWHAVRTTPEDLKLILAAFEQKSGALASHSSQVFFIKADGTVFGRTTGLPDSAGVAGILNRLP